MYLICQVGTVYLTRSKAEKMLGRMLGSGKMVYWNNASTSTGSHTGACIHGYRKPWHEGEDKLPDCSCPIVAEGRLRNELDERLYRAGLAD